ncbi:L-threonylcarbamoyladenylate synthase [Desulfohalovibrio reitneri]|uniref:L-threonylcarbamoyladenylate synthase n=1 Tax=Desulfohalovibrio reitneri TaxID=1307759 RepID=UPI0004A70C9A|nr:L-threonylcarbamoyladenylate synthase [Desulfohalovibrio reitneri]
MQKAVQAIRDGKLVIYPTETLYALGCSAFNAEGARRVIELKARPATKPLPIIIGHMDQLSMVTGWFSKAFAKLTREFWPGPLSILVPTGRRLPSEVRDPSGFTSLRLTAHPLAAKLCIQTGGPLISTSANISGGPAAARPSEIDPMLNESVAATLREKPWPGGGLPSTVVKCLGTDELAVIREGAVSLAKLRDAGFTLHMS